jgi:MraZ protein
VARTFYGGRYEGRIDRKGRITVPSEFRSLLVAQGGQRMHVFPTPKTQAENPDSIDVVSEDRMQVMAEEIGKVNPYTEQGQALKFFMGQIVELTWSEPEGRVTLPQWLLDRAGITDQLLFVGANDCFQMWEPGRRAAFDAKFAPVVSLALQGLDFSRTKVAG